MKSLRFGIIGCGGIGKLHVSNAQFVPGMEIVAFADIDRQRAESFHAEFGGDYAADDPERLIADASLDGVLIATGEKHHAPLCIAAAKSGKHIFCEKPISVTVEEAIEIEQAVRRTGVIFMIGLCNRLAPAVQRAKRMLPNPWISFGQSADSVANQAVHNLDLLVNIFHEAPLVSVYASGGHYYGLDSHLPADSFVATLKFGDGSQACYIQHGKAYNALMTKYSIQLFGKDRCVFLSRRFKECHLSTGLAAPDHSTIFAGPDFSPSNPAEQEKDVRGPYGYMGHYDELVALVDAIERNADPPMTVEDGRYVLQVEKAIFESVTTNQVIDFSNFLAKWGCEPPIHTCR